MATGLTTTTSTSDARLTTQLTADGIVDALYDHDFARNFVVFASIAGAPTLSYDFVKLPSLSATAVAETADLSYSPYATDSVRATAAEVGLALGLTNLMRGSTILSDDRFSMAAGKGVADKRNNDVMAMSTGFSTSVGPASGNPLLEDHVQEAIARLAANNMGSLVGSITAAQKRDLVGDIGTTVTAGTGASLREQTNDLPGPFPDGQLGGVFGITFYMTEANPTINSGADVSGMIVDSSRAIGFVEKEPVRIAFDQDASARVNEVIATSTYGLVEIDDNAGIAVQSDAGP